MTLLPALSVERTKIYGPPGSGKTALLTRLFIEAARTYGPQRVAAVTYTRAAAAELKGRVAEELGIRGGFKSLNRQLPFVGTIHSLAYHLLGVAQGELASEHLSEFCKYVKISYPGELETDPEYLEGFWWTQAILDGRSADLLEADAFLRCLGMARHQQISIDQAFEQLPIKQQLATNVGRVAYLADQYTLWKRECDYLDFEDLLEEGAKAPLPVTVLLLDEAQDSSKLMFDTINAWAEGGECRRYAAAGDAFQSLYRFSGASPEVFLSQPGRVVKLKTSHRLSDEAVEYAKRVLELGGYPGAIDFFHGEGGRPVDGTTFYLARTHRLVAVFEAELMASGTPYASLRGRSPFESKAGDAYRAALGYERDGVMSALALQTVAERLPAGYLPPGEKARVGKMTGMVGWPSSPWPAPRVAMRSLPYSEYFQRIELKHGAEIFFQKPKISVSTIHGAKGREADTVILADSWAYLPARAFAGSEDGRRAEACVAYVACTRHRERLDIVDYLTDGIPYPFP